MSFLLLIIYLIHLCWKTENSLLFLNINFVLLIKNKIGRNLAYFSLPKKRLTSTNINFSFTGNASHIESSNSFYNKVFCMCVTFRNYIAKSTYVVNNKCLLHFARTKYIANQCTAYKWTPYENSCVRGNIIQHNNDKF